VRLRGGSSLSQHIEQSRPRGRALPQCSRRLAVRPPGARPTSRARRSALHGFTLSTHFPPAGNTAKSLGPREVPRQIGRPAHNRFGSLVRIMRSRSSCYRIASAAAALACDLPVGIHVRAPLAHCSSPPHIRCRLPFRTSILGRQLISGCSPHIIRRLSLLTSSSSWVSTLASSFTM